MALGGLAALAALPVLGQMLGWDGIGEVISNWIIPVVVLTLLTIAILISTIWLIDRMYSTTPLLTSFPIKQEESPAIELDDSDKQNSIEKEWEITGRRDENYQYQIATPLHNGNNVISLLREGRVLDVGCGAGIPDVVLALEGYSVAGIVLSTPQIKDARRLRNRLSVELKGRCLFINDDFSSSLQPRYFFAFPVEDVDRRFSSESGEYDCFSAQSYSPDEIDQVAYRLVFLPGAFGEEFVRERLEQVFGRFDNVLLTNK